MEDTKAPQPYDEACETAVRLGRDWLETDRHRATANREGWNVFGLPEPPDGRVPQPEDFLCAGIQRYDDATAWTGCNLRRSLANDETAVSLCRVKAAGGSDTHAIALRLERALNAMRRHAWGERWVDSRIGPPRGVDDLPQVGMAEPAQAA